LSAFWSSVLIKLTKINHFRKVKIISMFNFFLKISRSSKG
jgi:hypothetical protein